MYMSGNFSYKKAHALAYAAEHALKNYCGKGVCGEICLYIRQSDGNSFVLDTEKAGEAWPKGVDEPNIDIGFRMKGEVETSDKAVWALTRGYSLQKVGSKNPFEYEVNYGKNEASAYFASYSEQARIGIFVRLGTTESLFKAETPKYVAAAISIALKELTENDLQPFNDACFRVYMELLREYDYGVTYDNLGSLRNELRAIFATKLREDFIGEPVKILK